MGRSQVAGPRLDERPEMGRIHADVVVDEDVAQSGEPLQALDEVLRKDATALARSSART